MIQTQTNSLYFSYIFSFIFASCRRARAGLSQAAELPPLFHTFFTAGKDRETGRKKRKRKFHFKFNDKQRGLERGKHHFEAFTPDDSLCVFLRFVLLRFLVATS